MRIFTDFTTMYKEVGRDLVEMGVTIPSHSVQANNVEGNPDFDMREIVGYAYKLTVPEGFHLPYGIFDGREQKWLIDEAYERMSEYYFNPGDSWKHRKEVWEPMMVEGRFHYTYNERLRNQLPRIEHELAHRPGTRQAVATIYNEGDMKSWGGAGRVPCSMYYQFLLRKTETLSELQVVYAMRSCDYFTHFKFDSMLALLIGEHFANMHEVKTVTLTHFLGSFHCFRKDWEKAGIF